MGRGTYRGVYGALVDDPDFQRLTPNARLVFLVARLCQQAGPAAIFRYYPEILAKQSGLGVRAVTLALAELETDKWIYHDETVLWIKNGLRHDPMMRLGDRRHRVTVERWLEGLPNVDIVAKFRVYYDLGGSNHSRSRLSLGEGEGEGVGEGKGVTTEATPAADAAADPTPSWGKPEHLVALYNTLTPPGHPKVETLSPARAEKARRYLRQFPTEAFWRGVFTSVKLSAFLLGHKSGPGHEGFRGDFDWLLTKGKDGTENCVKVSEGRYEDKGI